MLADPVVDVAAGVGALGSAGWVDRGVIERSRVEVEIHRRGEVCRPDHEAVDFFGDRVKDDAVGFA